MKLFLYFQAREDFLLVSSVTQNRYIYRLKTPQAAYQIYLMLNLLEGYDDTLSKGGRKMFIKSFADLFVRKTKLI